MSHSHTSHSSPVPKSPKRPRDPTTPTASSSASTSSSSKRPRLAHGGDAGLVSADSSSSSRARPSPTSRPSPSTIDSVCDVADLLRTIAVYVHPRQALGALVRIDGRWRDALQGEKFFRIVLEEVYGHTEKRSKKCKWRTQLRSLVPKSCHICAHRTAKLAYVDFERHRLCAACRERPECKYLVMSRALKEYHLDKKYLGTLRFVLHPVAWNGCISKLFLVSDLEELRRTIYGAPKLYSLMSASQRTAVRKQWKALYGQALTELWSEVEPLYTQRNGVPPGDHYERKVRDNAHKWLRPVRPTLHSLDGARFERKVELREVWHCFRSLA